VVSSSCELVCGSRLLMGVFITNIIMALNFDTLCPACASEFPSRNSTDNGVEGNIEGYHRRSSWGRML